MTKGKLVRDSIPDIIRAAGRSPDIRRLDDDDYVAALHAKLTEEVDELHTAIGTNSVVEEAADVLEVLINLVKLHDRTLIDLLQVAAAKRAAKGSFVQRLWLQDDVTTPPPNPKGSPSAAPKELETFLAATCYKRDEVFGKPCPVPKAPGVYGWWFRYIPGSIDTSGCQRRDGLTLLYAGISPSRPSANGGPPSSQDLRKRIQHHYRGDAEGSTLRKTLGVLVADELGIELRRVGSGTRRTFGPVGEAALSRWMAEHALVSWVVHPKPWLLEDELIAGLDLPMNLQGNAHNSFYPILKGLRAEAAQKARNLPVLKVP